MYYSQQLRKSLLTNAEQLMKDLETKRISVASFYESCSFDRRHDKQ